MILDTLEPGSTPDEVKADVIVVGAGTMGLFLAKCLAKDALDVVLFEAGGRVAGTSENAQMAQSRGKTNFGVTHGRARGLGGTSLLWGGQLAEFEGADVDDGTDRWPIPFSELHRWYDAVYRELGVGTRLSDAAYCQRFGGETSSHPHVERFFTVWLPQPNFARLFRDELSSSPRIRTILNATVNGIEFDGSRATGVRAVTRSGKRVFGRGRHVVFASGTIETCRFFLSTKQRGGVPWASSRNIGAYFHDHLGGRIAGVEVLDEPRFREYFENGIAGGVKLQPKLRLTAAARQGAQTGVCGMFAFRSSISENLARIKELARSLRAGAEFSRLTTALRDAGALGRSFLPLVLRYVRDKRIMAFYDQAVDFHAQAEQLPIANSRITLCESDFLADGLGRVTLEWRVDGREIHAIRDFALKADAYLREQGIAKLQIESALLGGDAAFLESLSDTYHQCGGMLMASRADKGVVDADCRVFGTENVYVAGASVFPTSGHANSSLTALALAARLASSLRG